MKLTPQWIVGFVDRSATFFLRIEKKESYRYGARLRPEFRIVQSQSDREILESLMDYFRCGHIRQNHSKQFEYRVRDNGQLRFIVDFLLRHPLKSQKQNDVLLMDYVLQKIEEKEHLSKAEIQSIVKAAKPLTKRPRYGIRG